MAEALANKAAAKYGIDVSATSAGLQTSNASPASLNAVIAMQRMGADISEHISRQITAEMISDADNVYAMTERHSEILKNMYPQFAQKIHTIKCGGDICDPFGGDIEVYNLCAAELQECVNVILGIKL